MVTKKEPKPTRPAEDTKAEAEIAEKAKGELKDSDLTKVTGGAGFRKVVRKKG